MLDFQVQTALSLQLVLAARCPDQLHWEPRRRLPAWIVSRSSGCRVQATRLSMDGILEDSSHLRQSQVKACRTVLYLITSATALLMRQIGLTAIWMFPIRRFIRTTLAERSVDQCFCP